MDAKELAELITKFVAANTTHWANNRLYLVDLETGDTLYLMRSNAPKGWGLAATKEEIEAWLEGRDRLAVEGANRCRSTSLALFAEDDPTEVPS